jgi:hypothetical protein
MDTKPMVVHYRCRRWQGGGSPLYKPTGKRGDPDNPEDETEVYQCEACRSTVGIEQLPDGRWVVYF